MRILGLRAENFKNIQVIELMPDRDGHLIQITGKNGAGKTSTLDGIMYGLKGKKALKGQKWVRRGATERMMIQLKLGDEEVKYVVTRTQQNDAARDAITLETKDGSKITEPQQLLDRLFDELTFDPLEFVNLEPREQVALLRKTAKIKLDFEELERLDKEEYQERLQINREIDKLAPRVAAMTVLDGLPQQKLDEAPVRAKLASAAEEQARQVKIDQARADLGVKVRSITMQQQSNARFLDSHREKITEIERQLQLAKDALKAAEAEDKRLEKERAAAEKAFLDAPAGQPVNIAALLAEQESIRRTNEAIDRRGEYNALKAELDEKQRRSDEITNLRKNREELRRQAVTNARIPVKGISFDENEVRFNGLPIKNLGEGEQIRISAQIGMAANPELRVMCIRHGEALDEDGIKALYQLAEEYDFQIWMAQVETSGKVGIVLQDGMIVARNEVKKK